MLSIPYFHFSRQPLKEVYEKEYSEINKNYETEILKWKNEWLNFLWDKYKKEEC